MSAAAGNLDFFVQPDPGKIQGSGEYPSHALGASILRLTARKELPSSPSVILIGLDDFRQSSESLDTPLRSWEAAADWIRAALYTLPYGKQFPSVADLGNMIPGRSFEDTLTAMAQVSSDLRELGHIPVWMGGSLPLLRGIFKGFKGNGPTDVSVVSSRTHFKTGPGLSPYEFVLRSLVEYDSLHLFNLSCLAGQGHYQEAGEPELLEQMRFEQLRLGPLRQHPDWAEPLLRSSAFTVFSLSSVRWSDTDGNLYSGPNGLFAHEFCQLSHYAGANELLKAAFFCDYFPSDSPPSPTTELSGTQTQSHAGAHVLAQGIWYLLEGISQRCDDTPRINSRNYTRYTMALPGEHELIFVKSQKSGRWWIEVTLPVPAGSRKERSLLVPCTYDDYLKATSGELPDRWWRIHQKYLQ
ncbi:MAG: hypothetical protein FJ343_01455 [Sphingomonadales bacterium]|nr:hypothetical protein [Sphingomonadales bacterium]